MWMKLCAGAVAMACSAGQFCSADAIIEDTVGRGARVFVTKTYPGHGRLTDADFKQLADAGFTVVVNMWLEDVPAYAKGATKAGLSAMTWNMGIWDADEGDNIDRTLTRQGQHTRFTLPYSKAGWDKVTEQVLEHARISVQYPALKGALLDFEIYDPAKTDGFCESYDDASFIAFLKEQGRAAPEPLTPPADRRAYLDNLQILSLYIDWQARQVATRARELRKAIDAVNPDFQIGVYGWGVFKDHVMRAVATDRAPVLDLDANLYGRTIWSNAFEGGYDAEEPDHRALKWSIETASRLAREARDRDYPAILLNGHYPQSPGPKEHYKFTARQSFNSVAYADGYWIWTDWWLPEPWTDKQEWIDAMMAYWTQSNAALDAGDWTWSAREPDTVELKDPTPLQYVLTTDGSSVSVWNPITGERLTPAEPVEFPQHNAAGTLAQRAFRIDGWVVRPVQGRKPDGYNVGHGTVGLAMADVDQLPGDELVTLNAGWVKVWAPETRSQLLRFRVGSDQKNIAIVPAERVKLAETPD